MPTNLTAFRDALAACEGTGTHYDALFGFTERNGKVFTSYGTHPNLKVQFVQTDGQANYSTAAGRYQIIYPTFLRLQTKLGTTDFSPATQDAMADELIAEAGAMGYVKDGDLGAAVEACSKVWASLPSSTYPQPTRPYDFVERAYVAAGGVVA